MSTTTQHPAYEITKEKALDVCAAILRRSLSLISDNSARGDDASARVAWLAESLDQYRKGRIGVYDFMEQTFYREPRSFIDGDPSGAAVKHACQAIRTILDSFDA